MWPYRLGNGNLMVPMTAVSEDGRTVGDGFVEITPEHPDWGEWLAEVEAAEREPGMFADDPPA